MNVYIISEAYECENICIVFAKTELRAKRLYWVNNQYNEYSDFDDLYEIDKVSPEDSLEIFKVIGDSPEFGKVINVEEDENGDFKKLKPLLRKMKWRCGHENTMCEICGLYPLGMDEYFLNDEGTCKECANFR